MPLLVPYGHPSNGQGLPFAFLQQFFIAKLVVEKFCFQKFFIEKLPFENFFVLVFYIILLIKKELFAL